jgi:hypothetical protein
MRRTQEVKRSTVDNKIKKLKKHFNPKKRGGHAITALKNDKQAKDRLAQLEKL